VSPEPDAPDSLEEAAISHRPAARPDDTSFLPETEFKPGWSKPSRFSADGFSGDSLKTQLKKYGRWLAYPALYLVLFVVFAYVTFPYERLRQRLISAYNATQIGKASPNRMQIGDLTWSWRFPGVVLSDVELIGPKPKPVPQKPGAQEKPAKPPTRSTIHVGEIYATVSLWSALTGSADVEFNAEGFGGNLKGEFTRSDEMVSLDVEFDQVDPGQLPGVIDALQLPLSGVMTGTIELNVPEGKYSKAEGTIDIEVEDLRVGDGKTKIRDLFALPEVQAGTLTVQASVSEGKVKVERFAAAGPDLEVESDGKLRLKDDLSTTLVEQMNLGFKFSDKYRDKDDTTRALLGKPGDRLGGAIDLDPKVKRAKQADGFYRWRITGPVTRLSFQPGRPVVKSRPGRGGLPRKKSSTKSLGK
jgi:type II secretion system protein N